MSQQLPHFFVSFFFNDPATTEIYTLSLHDALPISMKDDGPFFRVGRAFSVVNGSNWSGPVVASHAAIYLLKGRSEEHTSELQSQSNLVCRLLLEKKKKQRHRDSPLQLVLRLRAEPA